MMPQSETDQKAEEWFNKMLECLRYSQDYTICFGHSKKMIEDGKEVGISIRRPYIRLFSTGVTKMYQMAVLGEKLPKVEYTEAEEKELDEAIEKTENQNTNQMNIFQVKQLKAQWKRLNRRNKQEMRNKQPNHQTVETMNIVNKKLTELDSSWNSRITQY